MSSLPAIDGSETLDVLAGKLRGFFVKVIDAPHSWEELRREKYAKCLRPLVRHLADDVSHDLIVCALLALKWQFAAEEREDERGVHETRGLACELVAWRFVTYLSEAEALSYLCTDLPAVAAVGLVERQDLADAEAGQLSEHAYDYFDGAEDSPLLGPSLEDSFHEDYFMPSAYLEPPHFAEIFSGLNALEIAVVAVAKKFLRQRPIQRIIDDIWTGDVVFWETLSTHSTKQARMYRKADSDPFCRLRVPLYLKIFEAWFFAAFLVFYYIVLVEKEADYITFWEIMLYIWFVSFAYNELGEFWDAGSVFYAADFWSLWDVGIIATGTAFFIARIIGFINNDSRATDAAFDILSVEALFLVPRLFSLLSLHPYFGMLIPALKEMTKDFMKFLGIVVILYLGFTTCFGFLARGTFTFQHMNWILIKVFFGSSYLGFDISEKISPIFAPILMVIFVALTNVLLITSMISLLSNTLTKFMLHARDEYIFVYSVYVLEASTSNRLTYFLPPLNLVPLCLRPVRLWASAQTLRTARILLLKATHWLFVAIILGYETGRLYFTSRREPVRGVGARRSVATWGTGVSSSRLRQATSPISLLRRPRLRIAAHVNSRSRFEELTREARMSTIRIADVHEPAPLDHATVALRTTTTPPTILTSATTTDLAEMATVVANLHKQVEQLRQMMMASGADSVRGPSHGEVHNSNEGE